MSSIEMIYVDTRDESTIEYALQQQENKVKDMENNFTRTQWSGSGHGTAAVLLPGFAINW